MIRAKLARVAHSPTGASEEQSPERESKKAGHRWTRVMFRLVGRFLIFFYNCKSIILSKNNLKKKLYQNS